MRLSRIEAVEHSLVAFWREWRLRAFSFQIMELSQDAQRRNAGLTESTNNPDGAAAAECSFAMSEYSNTMSATAEQNVLQRRIHLAAYSDSAPQPVSGGSRSMFYYMFKCMVLKYFSTVTVIIRRVHDFGKSGWWLFVPTYKIILFAFIKGDEGANEFGAPE